MLAQACRPAHVGVRLVTPGTIDARVVRIFERWGFAWGRWSVPDPMPSELAALAR